MVQPLYSRDIFNRSSSFSDNGYLVEFCTDDSSSSSSIFSHRSSASTGKMWIHQELPKALVQRPTQCPPPRGTAPWGVPRSCSENRRERSFVSGSKPKSQEEIRIKELVDRANQHQSETARISDLRDFDNLTFTLPAADNYKDVKLTPVHTKKKTLEHAREYQIDTGFPMKKCSLIPLPPSNGMQKAPRRRRGQMFRGKKSWTSSAAAGSMIAEARNIDRHYYYQSSIGNACSVRSSVGESDFVDNRKGRDSDIAVRSRNKRWKSPFAKLCTPRSTLIDV